MELLKIPLIKEMCNCKSDEDLVKLKLRRYPKSSTSDIYEFKMTLFDHSDPEEFMLLLYEFSMTLATTGALEMDAKIQYLYTPIHGEGLRQFGFLSADVEDTETPNVDYYIKGLASYFSL